MICGTAFALLGSAWPEGHRTCSQKQADSLGKEEICNTKRTRSGIMGVFLSGSLACHDWTRLQAMAHFFLRCAVPFLASCSPGDSPHYRPIVRLDPMVSILRDSSARFSAMLPSIFHCVKTEARTGYTGTLIMSIFLSPIRQANPHRAVSL